MNTFELVSKYVKENNITEIVVGDNNWINLIKHISKHYPNLDSEYFGNVLFEELIDLNVKFTFEDDE